MTTNDVAYNAEQANIASATMNALTESLSEAYLSEKSKERVRQAVQAIAHGAEGDALRHLAAAVLIANEIIPLPESLQ